MKKQYKALEPIGPWKKGDVIGDLSKDQITKFLAEKKIEEIKMTAKPKTATKEVIKNG